MVLFYDMIGKTLVVHMKGELDHHSAEYVRIKVDEKLDEKGAKNIIFDFSEVNFMDSSGIGVVLGRYRKVHDAYGKAGVINLKSSIKKIFDMGGLFKVVTLYENLQDAVSNI